MRAMQAVADEVIPEGEEEMAVDEPKSEQELKPVEELKPEEEPKTGHESTPEEDSKTGQEAEASPGAEKTAVEANNQSGADDVTDSSAVPDEKPTEVPKRPLSQQKQSPQPPADPKPVSVSRLP